MYLFYDENNKVNLIYYVDLPEELISLPHFSLEVLPEPKNIEGKESVLKCDGKKVWYEYREIEQTEIDKTISALGQELVNLKLELMTMKGGI